MNQALSLANSLKALAFSILAICGLQQTVLAEDPIFIFAITGGTPPQELQISGSNITDLITEVTKRQGEFSSFTGEDFTANLSYLGVRNAILFDFSADGKTATVSIPSANYSGTFSAADANKLSDNLEDFMKTEGSQQIAALRQFVNTVSPVGVTDGNPISTTALLSHSWIDALSDHTESRSLSNKDKFHKNLVQFDISQTTYNAASFNGSLSEADLRISRQLNESLGIVMILPFNYQLIEESQVFGAGAGLAIPLTLMGKNSDSHFRWKLSPLAGGMFRISEDLASGGGVLSYGLNSIANWKLTDQLSISAITQYNLYQGVPYDIEGYELDHTVDQSLITLGTELSYSSKFKLKSTCHLLGMHYLKDAAIADWVDVGAKLEYPLSNHFRIQASYSRIQGGDFEANRISLNAVIRF